MEEAQFLEELYEIVKQNKGGAYEDVICKKASYPYLYHLSRMRQNLIDWLPITKEMRVLERNAECGALTEKLLAMAGEVVCVTEDEAHAAVIRERCTGAGERLTVVCGDTPVAMRYDVILIVGKAYRCRSELPNLRKMLKKNGRLILADANRLGLKYFAGCQEEYRGGYFTGISGYDTEEDAGMAAGNGCGRTLSEAADGRTLSEAADGRCYSRSEYETMLREAGFEKLTFYYPYPDHKFPSAVYSDEWLPHRGELAQNRINFDRDRIGCFDEGKAYDALLEEGVFSTFSNSFLIEAE